MHPGTCAELALAQLALARRPGAKLEPEQLVQVASYVLSRRGSSPANPKAVDPARDKPCS